MSNLAPTISNLTLTHEDQSIRVQMTVHSVEPVQAPGVLVRIDLPRSPLSPTATVHAHAALALEVAANLLRQTADRIGKPG